MIQTEVSRLLIEGAGELGVFLTDEHISAFERYIDELKVWAERMNLIRRKDEGEEQEILEVEASKVDQFKDYEVVDKMFFGYVSIFGDHCDEWGYFKLSELEYVKCPPFGIGIERDLYFEPKPISKVCPKAVFSTR